MPQNKKREEILARKRELEKKRYERIKNNPDLYAKYRENNKAKYQKRKRDGKVVSVHSLTPRGQKMLRRKWREDAKKSYQRKKEKRAQMKRFIECNSPPSSDVENVNIDNIVERIGSQRGERLSLTQDNYVCRRLTRSNSRSREVSPATSLASSVSSGMASPNTQRLVRKLRYKKDKEIASLRNKLQSVMKLNEAYRKKISRMKLQERRSSSIQPENEILGDNIQINSVVQLSRAPLLVRPSISDDNSFAEGVLRSYKSVKSYKMKQMISNILKPHLEASLQGSKKGRIKSMFRRRYLLLKNASVLQKKNDVKTFLSDDDNSNFAAGKKEYVKKEGVKAQKRYLNDSLGNLHKKFNSTHTYTLSYAAFCRFRPFFLASKRPREMCLCIIHENFQLLVSALHKYKIIESKDPTNLLKTICCNVYNAECLFRTCTNCKNNTIQFKIMVQHNNIDFCYWTWNSKAECVVQNGRNKVIRLVKKEKKITKLKEAIKICEEMIEKYMKHCGRMISQQDAIKKIKNLLKYDEAVIHVDFSENYKCAYAKKIQSAHFGASKSQITIHTSVLYFFDDNGQKKTQCFATISPNLRHDTAAVWAHMEPIMDFIKIHSPQVQTFHVISDSASSQYRNYKIYFVVTALKRHVPQLKCVTWNYSESGHGKGAPDGVGAVLKRTADACVNHGADIPDFKAFFQLLKQNLRNIIVDTISDYKIFEKDILLPSTLLPFKGTQQVHQIVWCNTKSTSVVLRSLSCTKETCLTKSEYCPHGKHLGFHEVIRREDNTPQLKRKSTIKSSSVNDARVIESCLDANDDRFLAPGTSAAEDIDLNESVTVLHRSTPFSSLSEIELPPELQRSTLDRILNEGPANVVESSLSSAEHVIDSDSDSDYRIF